jgi:hypothetical protein
MPPPARHAHAKSCEASQPYEPPLPWWLEACDQLVAAGREEEAVELVQERLLERDQYSQQTMTNASSMAHDFRCALLAKGEGGGGQLSVDGRFCAAAAWVAPPASAAAPSRRLSTLQPAAAAASGPQLGRPAPLSTTSPADPAGPQPLLGPLHRWRPTMPQAWRPVPPPPPPSAPHAPAGRCTASSCC